MIKTFSEMINEGVQFSGYTQLFDVSDPDYDSYTIILIENKKLYTRLQIRHAGRNKIIDIFENRVSRNILDDYKMRTPKELSVVDLLNLLDRENYLELLNAY
jgi:hypothetical protein